MISLIGGELYQWDTGRIVKVDPDENVIVHEVHFTTKRMDYAYVLKTYTESGTTYCAIPNIILQQNSRLLCYEVCENSNGEETIAETIFDIIRRNKPEDYVYTEQEHFTFTKLENRLDKVEKSSHSHENKAELDTITEDDLETWRSSSKDVLTYTEQILTDEQKAQARINIGIPEKIATEEYVNSQGFLKEHQSLTDYAKKTEIPTVPTKVSAFENDSGYLTEHQSLTDYAKKTDVVQSDWNQNDQTTKDYIKNRIGGYEANIDPITISWDGNTEGKTVVADQLYLVSNETPTANQLIGGTIKYVIIKNGETTSENLTITEDAIGSYANENIIIGEFCVIIHSPGTVGNATFEKTGIYFAGIFGETQTIYVNELTTVSAIGIIKIPEKYLDAATKAQVATAQTTANTAQTTANTVTNAVKKVIFSTASFTFDKVTSGRDTFRYNAFSYYKISDFNVNKNDVISFYGTRENGKELSSIDVGNNCVEYGLFIIVASPGECSLNIRDHVMSFTAPSAGLYACYENGNDTITAGTGIFTMASIPTNTVGIQSTGLNLQSSSNNLIKEYKVTIDDESLRVTNISDNASKKLATEDYVTSQFKSIPVDGTTIKFNDQGQLTLALGNANGVNF